MFEENGSHTTLNKIVLRTTPILFVFNWLIVSFDSYAAPLISYNIKYGISSFNPAPIKDSKNVGMKTAGLALAFSWRAKFGLGVFIDGAILRSDNEGAQIPLSKSKLDEKYFGGGVSLGNYMGIVVNLYGGKSMLFSYLDENLAGEAIKPHVGTTGYKAGVNMLTTKANMQKFKRGGNLVLNFGIGGEKIFLRKTSDYTSGQNPSIDRIYLIIQTDTYVHKP